MSEAKECNTPMSSTQHLQLLDGSFPTNATRYQQVVGSLQYLSLTRPDVSYAVNKLARFMHSPTETHWSAVKRVLHYLKSTIHYGLFLRRNRQLDVTAFTNADWTGNLDNYTSTSAYVVYLGGNAISWCSKK